jgi:hypothetical protein
MVLEGITRFVRSLPGKRTYLAAGASILVSLAGIFGTMPCEKCMTIGVGLVALAQVFQRFASANQDTKVGDLYEALLETSTTIEQLAGTPPKTIPMRPVTPNPPQPAA